MITLTVGCILMGCLQDVPIVVGDPVRYYSSQIMKSKQNLDKPKMSCYVEGVFYEVCPK